MRRTDACLRWPLILLLISRPALSACFYDGVSETQLSHMLQQLSQNYGVSALSPLPADSPVPQPLGTCSLDEFLALIAQHSRWQAQTTAAGLVLTLGAPAPVEKSAPVQRVIPEVVVVGMPGGLSNARETAYSSTGLVGQTDMAPGTLTGASDLTTSLGRLSAVTFSQEAGMDRNISIRGLSADYSRVLVNGMPMLATSTSIDARGAVNNSRSFDFNVLPQGLFTQALVNKTTDARSGEGAIGGTVDLRTPLPPDSDDAQQWLSLQGETNVTNGAGGSALAGGFSGRAADQSLGWLLGFSLRQRTTQERGYSTVRWQTSDWGDQDQLSAEQQEELDTLFHPRHNRYDLLLRSQDVAGVTAALQWQDKNLGTLGLTVLRAQMQQSLHEYHISAVSLKDEDLSDVVVNDYATDASGMVYGSFSNVDIRSEHNYEVDTTDLSQVKLDWQLPLSAAWTLNSSLGFMNSHFWSPVHDKVSLTAYGQDFSYDLRGNSRIAVNHYGFDITDPAQWQLSRITMTEDELDNRYRVGSMELTFDPGVGLRQYLGLQYQDFANDRGVAEYDNDSVSGLYSAYYQLTPGNFGRGLGVSGLPRNWVVGSQSLIRALGLADATLSRDPTAQSRLDETTWSGWWQTDFELWNLPWPVRGDAGVRWSATEQRVRGAWLIDDDVQAVDNRNLYHNWLPALHLVAHARDDLLLRFGYSRNLARPSIDNLTSALQLRSSARLVEGGNNRLRPSRAHAFDLAAEWYGDERQFLSAGLFYKRIDSVIVEQVEDVTLDQLPYYNPAWASLSDGGEYSYRRPVNGPGTDIAGVELAAELPFLWLPPPFNRAGLDAGYALSHGLVRYPTDDGQVTLDAPGLSRHVATADLWYRAHQLRAGMTLRARSRYLTRVPGNNDNDREGVNAAVIVGAYASWQLSAALSVSLDARNLTNQAYDQFVDKTNRVYSYSTTGTELMLGVSWRFGD